ncbi:MAG TPA: type B 50S ribosomal protein L31 [Candidatus Paceibacterota bacterium]|jgi:large subunit ribosomal protein L31|nr:50S ribosomal protein L31 [Parcubacteria group bacterium]MDP6119718.1 type B 50S ribosomal protein L31 [Candidatus Paceibacterota bacterium]HJN63076.1 type B 50S ribosomal protein L31 [Candidatus Paceibacterota bacterium]|tara:strand:- start:1860 stop:2174 length:315 start_codon:yes stop_codon:yes gene_type:complete
MKKDIHPENYRQVIFLDTSSGERFLISSTAETDKTDKWKDGKEYPLKEIEISSASHPFYTGKDTVVDTAGRVEKFKARRAAQQKGVKSKAEKKAEKKTKRESKK